MKNGFLEGLIKPEVNIETDMSETTKNTYVTYNIGTLIITDKDVAERLIAAIECSQHPFAVKAESDNEVKPT